MSKNVEGVHTTDLMNKKMNKNVKMLILFIIGIIISSGISVCATATYLASQITYTKTDGTSIKVDAALNNLYEKTKGIDDADATASDILSGKKAFTKSGLITGTYAPVTNEVYSTQEQVVGQWIDNKPIYRFCYQFTKTATGYVEVSFKTMGLTDYKKFDKIIRSESKVISSPNNFCPNEYYFASSDYYGNYITQGRESVMFRSGSDWPKLPSQIAYIIEYTKTTD